MAICIYEREIERYGGLKNIEHAEALFCADTQGVIQMLQSIKWDAPILHTLSIIALVKDFNLKPEEVFGLLEGKQSLQGVRAYRKQLLSLVNESEGIAPFHFASQIRLPILEKFHSSELEIYNSILHMHCNRLGCDIEAEKRARCYAYHLKGSWGYNPLEP